VSKGILLAVFGGILAGHILIPILPFGPAYLAVSGGLVIVALCVLLFLVGIEIGRDDTVIEEIKAVGFRILLFPLAAILGTYIFTAVASFFLSVTVREAMAIGGGFGWYSFAPTILLAHSVHVSAICFLQNVIRELLGIVLIPIVAKWIGYIEASALPGVASMDVCLPVIEKSTGTHITIYAFVIGIAMALVVPLAGIIVG
jgi:uncharacterized membrane protein YbjE (DUF340 family)